nr:MAG TPA: hypothetical protein [Caudoviricetes sp.]
MIHIFFSSCPFKIRNFIISFITIYMINSFFIFRIWNKC